MALQKQVKGKRRSLKSDKLADTDEDIDSEKKTSVYSRKRCRTREDGRCEDEEDLDDRNYTEEDVMDIIQSFKDDVQKALISKRQRAEAFTNEAYEANVRIMRKMADDQSTERKQLNVQFFHHVERVIEQWEQDLKKTMENEDNLCAIIKQQQKLMQQNRAANSHRLKSLRQLHETYSKGVEDLDECHSKQHAYFKEELKKELADLQKKILQDNQRQDIANVRKSLSSVLLDGM